MPRYVRLVRSAMPSESSFDRDVIEDVRMACEKSGRPADEAEIRRALEKLSPEEI